MKTDWKKNERTREILVALADANLNVTEVSRRLFLNRNTVVYHVEKVKRHTGLDPTKFHDLCKLLEYEKVVRCGECWACNQPDCPMSGSPGEVSASDFCSYGVRRDENESCT